jgi:catechol 2,3-dioxygenase
MLVPADAAIGAVHLTIASLERSVGFYEGHLGFRTHQRSAATAALGAGGDDLLVLHESASAPRVTRTTGLYHFAILVPSRLELAHTLQRLAGKRTPMQGFSDHGVSEAIYLADPDGNGIEVYRDKPRAEWPITDGRLRMVSEPLDIENLLGEVQRGFEAAPAPWTGLTPETRIGHVHLHVSFLEDTAEFYRDLLGFTLTQRYGESALFFAAGDYHHHVGANVWAGVGAPRPPVGAIGLRHFEIRLPDQSTVDAVVSRVREAGRDVRLTGAGAALEDPSGNQIIFSAPR